MIATEMPTKKCSSCGVEKCVSNYRKAQNGIHGVAGRCKYCQSLVDAEYRKTPERQATVSRFIHSPKHKINTDRWKSNNLPKRRAHEAVNNAIRDGRMERGLCCKCGSKAEAHHHDYDKPLDVTWLCTAHHKELHWEGSKCKNQNP